MSRLDSDGQDAKRRRLTAECQGGECPPPGATGSSRSGSAAPSYDEGIDIYHVKNITFGDDLEFGAALKTTGVNFLRAHMYGKARTEYGVSRRHGFVTIERLDVESGKKILALAGRDFGPPRKATKLFVDPLSRTLPGQYTIAAEFDTEYKSLPTGASSTEIMSKHFTTGSFTHAWRKNSGVPGQTIFLVAMSTVCDFCDVLVSPLPAFVAIRPAYQKRPSPSVAGKRYPIDTDGRFRNDSGDTKSSPSGGQARFRDCDGKPGDRVKRAMRPKLVRFEDKRAPRSELELQRREVMSSAEEKPGRPDQPNVEVERSMDFSSGGHVAVKMEAVVVEPPNEPPVVPAERLPNPSECERKESMLPRKMLSPKRKELAVPASLIPAETEECNNRPSLQVHHRRSTESPAICVLREELRFLCEKHLHRNLAFLVSNLSFTIGYDRHSDEFEKKTAIENDLKKAIATRLDVGVAHVKLLDFPGACAVVGVKSERDAAVLNDPANRNLDVFIGAASCGRVSLTKIQDKMSFNASRVYDLTTSVSRSQVDDLVLLSAADNSKAEVLSYTEDGTFMVKGDLYNLLVILAMSGRISSSGYKYTHQFIQDSYNNFEAAPPVPLPPTPGYRSDGYEVDDSQTYFRSLLVKNACCSHMDLVAELKRMTGMKEYILTKPGPERHSVVLSVSSQQSFELLLRQNGVLLKGGLEFRAEVVPYGN